MKKDFGRDFIIINPGIRMPDDDAGDQKRVSTPKDAISAGADFIVMGRSIIGAIDPAAKAAEVLSSL